MYVDVVLAETGLGDDVSSVALAVRGEDKASSFATVADDLDIVDFHSFLQKSYKRDLLGISSFPTLKIWVISSLFWC